MSRLERAAFSVILGLLWAWMMIQDLADRYGCAPAALAAGILAASVGLWWSVLLLLERLTNGHHSAEIRDSDR